MHLIPAERCVGPLPSFRINFAFRETASLRGVALLINGGKTMPARPSHIPHAMERSTLQRMSPTVGMPSEKLHPAGKQIIAKMVAKGWIERQSDARGRHVYCITVTGLEALKAPIPKGR
jgi:hypothetical protein